MEASNPSFLKGHLATLVLHLLSENERMYGYEITRAVKEKTAGRLQLTEGALYPVLHKLEAGELLHATIEVVDGRARKYYSLQPAGLTKASESRQQLLLELHDLIRIFDPPKPQYA